MDYVRLGILGASEGNGHPYSWSAIFNGYQPAAMSECGFPIISTYLAKQLFPRDCIPRARVTHVWTQEKSRSMHIAEATFIDKVVEEAEDMIGQVDAVLLARDDCENHRQFAEPFIAAGLPIYIDKPLALSRKAAAEIFTLEMRPGQIFSCSALRFSREMLLTPHQIKIIGGINHISAVVPNSWNKYAIHAIDPILKNCGSMGHIRNVRVHKFGSNGGGAIVSFDWGENQKLCEIKACGNESSPIAVEYYGPKGVIKTRFSDSYAAFKSALEVFVADSVLGRKSYCEDIMNSVEILELGA